MAEGEADPAGKRAIAQWVQSDRVFGLARCRTKIEIACCVSIELRRGCGGKRCGIENFPGIEAGEWIAQNRHAIRGGYAERSDLVGEFRCGASVQAAYLDAAARGDLDDAVAMATRRRAQSGERIERNSA